MLDLRAENRGNDARCPYCHASVLGAERLWTCPRCTTEHHEDCARENGQCTLLGCPELVNVPARADLPRVERSPREAASTFQDLLVLGVSLPSLAAVGVGVAATVHDRPSDDAIGYGPVLLALGFVALLGAVLRFARRRDEAPRPVPRKASPAKK